MPPVITQLRISPWMVRFLDLVAGVQEELILVAPFIKLSLVRPLLLALPSQAIRLQILTRFNARDFASLASDFAAVELLAALPGLSYNGKIHALNRLHAKLYIFDRRRIIIGSSNLSVSGLNRNFEVVVESQDRDLIAEALVVLASPAILAEQLPDSAFTEMRARLRLQTDPVPPDGSLDGDWAESSPPIADELLHPESEGESENASEYVAEKLLKDDDRRDRLVAADRILASYYAAEMNSLNGVEFEAAKLVRQRGQSGAQTAADHEIYAAAKRRDLLRIERELLPRFQIPMTDEDRAAGLSVFVHGAEINEGSVDRALRFTTQGFSTLGEAIFKLVVRLHFSKQIAYDAGTAARAALAEKMAVCDGDYAAFLSSRGLHVLHHRSDLDHGVSRRLFFGILGLICTYQGMPAAERFGHSFIEESVEQKTIAEATFDPKTALQNFAGIKKRSILYATNRAGGTDNEPLFSSTVTLGMRAFGPVVGPSKKEAEVRVAKVCLQRMAEVSAEREALDTALSYGCPTRPRARYSLGTEREGQLQAWLNGAGIGVPFSLALVDVALTHGSATQGDPRRRPNTKLSYVGAEIPRILLLREVLRYGAEWADVWRQTKETRLQPLRSDVLPKVFDAMGLSAVFSIRRAEELSPNVKADAVQALLAVMFLDGGLPACARFWRGQIEPLLPGEPVSNWVGALQELTQSRKMTAATYTWTQDRIDGKGVPRFLVQCRLENGLQFEADGPNVKHAKQIAARKAYEVLTRESERSGSNGA